MPDFTALSKDTVIVGDQTALCVDILDDVEDAWAEIEESVECLVGESWGLLTSKIENLHEEQKPESPNNSKDETLEDSEIYSAVVG